MGEIEYDILRCDSRVDKAQDYLYKIANEHYSKEQKLQILAAIDMAAYGHKNQLRCDGAPFIIHPMRVALLLLEFDRENTIFRVFIGGLLHDTLEKTAIGLNEIEEKFGSYVAELVQSVTREHSEEQSPQEKTNAKRQNWLKLSSASHGARMIKVCEDLDNMICWKSIPENHPGREKIPRWLEEAESMSLLLARMTNLEAERVMRQEYEYYVKHGF